MKLLRIIVVAVLVVAGAGEGARGEESARDALGRELTAVRTVKNLQADFVCEKRIAALEEPLVSGGRIVVAGAGRLRFSTLRPYVSEVILDGGKLWMKSQHETGWTKGSDAGRPGLSAIMEQMAAWSVGDISKLDETYRVARAEGKVPRMPGDGAATEPGKVGAVVMFELAPIKAEVAKAIRSLRLGIDGGTHYLVFLQVTTSEGDVTRYWFSHVKTDAELPAGVFSPDGGAHE